MLVKVLEITPELVKYHRFDNPDGPLISVRKAEVIRLKYANGKQEILTPLAPGAALPTPGQLGTALAPTPPPPAADSATPAEQPDTLRLPVNSVFLVRYANGTHAVLPPAAPVRDTAQSSLLGLNAEQRRQLGAQHARRYYHQSGPFWGAFALVVAISPIYGVVPTTCISLKHVAGRNLMAPQPQLLHDPAYASGYQRQANRRKAGRAWAGYSVGSAAYLAFFAFLAITLTGGL
ncbi:hypothetical protein [Hymenobacter psoromatis]|uniref:hypothetical protein n=1 Tax=Hymenobacter psoromatis TaxID=1484116 RepID=UPI001CBC36FC|nr:hypothetical protein [Hymenobacter psoromatis]